MVKVAQAQLDRSSACLTLVFLDWVRRSMVFLFAAFAIGIVAGLRSMLAPAAVSWVVRLQWLHLDGTWLAFFGYKWTHWILSAAALGELCVDKLPQIPSRKAPGPFLARIVSGSLCGAALTVASDHLILGLIAGAAGAIAGTLGGAELRSRAVKLTNGRDFPIALLEDLFAIGCACFALRVTQ